jgi:hypothetical protein
VAPFRLSVALQNRPRRINGLAASDADHRLFGNSGPNRPAFPDSAETLAYLKQH